MSIKQEPKATAAKNKNRIDAVCLGELLIDFVPLESNRSHSAQIFSMAAGGAPANVAVGLARLGHSVAFLSKVGDDVFGRFLLETLRANKVDTRAVTSTGRAPTGLAFVSIGKGGERSFSFYRNPCADALLKPSEVPVNLLTRARMFHFGSISLIHEPSRSSTFRAIEAAQRSGLLISFDPNLRRPLWPNLRLARRWILEGIEQAHVIKLNEEEWNFLDGDDLIREGTPHLWRAHHQLMIISLGKKGCVYRTRSNSGHVRGFRARSIDTTGAGDAFMAGLLSGLLKLSAGVRSFFEMPAAELEPILRFANACGALATTVRGGIPSLPHRGEVNRLLFRRRLKSCSRGA